MQPNMDEELFVRSNHTNSSIYNTKRTKEISIVFEIIRQTSPSIFIVLLFLIRIL